MSNPKALITGGAGFIGSHLAVELAKKGEQIVVVDSINDYYSVSLKEYRLKVLSEFSNIKIVRLNLQDNQKLVDLFKEHSFGIVYHLAAQAGVRLPTTSSHKYVHSNLSGFMNTLLQVRDFQVPDFMYASSSSIY